MKNILNRREFLQKTSAATLAAMAAGAPAASLLSGCTSGKDKTKLVGQRGTADTVILIWMAGGMAHTETFDPKRFTPYETGHGRQPGTEHV